LRNLAREINPLAIVPEYLVDSVQPPAPASEFVGREREVRRLDELLIKLVRRRTPIVVIEGAPGIGKTTLAAWWTSGATEHFPGGCLYADLADVTTESQLAAVLARFLMALGVPGPVVATIAQAELPRHFRAVTTGKRVLVVLDNASSSAQVTSLLPGPQCAVVVTSRKHLSDLALQKGAKSIPLAPLDECEARTLLGQIVDEARMAADPDAANLIARRCGRLPLALRLAAEQLAAQPQLTLRRLAEKLEPADGRLDALAPAGAIRGVMDVSYRMLPTAAARAFRLLGKHPGPALPLAAVAALTGTDVATAHAALDTLQEYSLIETTPDGRVDMHSILRLYAAERARDQELEADLIQARERLLHWYIASAAAAGDVVAPSWTGPAVTVDRSDLYPPVVFGDRYKEALSWFGAELEVIRALTREAGEHRDSQAWKLPVLYLPHLYLTKNWTACLELAPLGLNIARQAGDPVGIARCLHSFGWILHELKNDRDALPHLKEAMRLHETIDDGRGRAWTAHALGESLTGHGKYEEALTKFTLALDHFRNSQWPFGTAVVLSTMATTLGLLGRTDEAISTAQKALTLAQEIGIRPLQSRAHHELGLLHLRSGDPHAAIPAFEHARILRRDTNEQWGEADTLLNLGKALAALGRTDEARAALHESVTTFDDLHDPQARAARAELAQLDVREVPPASS
jgi:tetratricopeptide (TPR) repeat protein